MLVETNKVKVYQVAVANAALLATQVFEGSLYFAKKWAKYTWRCLLNIIYHKWVGTLQFILVHKKTNK